MLRIRMVLTISNLKWCHQSFVYRHESRSNWHRGHSQYQPFNIRQAFLLTTRHIFNNVMLKTALLSEKAFELRYDTARLLPSGKFMKPIYLSCFITLAFF